VNTKLPESSRIIGLDLAKKTFVGCILSGDGFLKKQLFQGKMTQDDQGWQLIQSKIRSEDLVMMEAGTSSFSLARYLENNSAAQRVIVLNPGMLRIIWMSQKKNDKSDATKLACIARDMAEEAWPTVSIPTEEEQAERAIITSYVFIRKQETQIANRLYALYNALGYPEIKRSEMRDNPQARRDMAGDLLAALPVALQESHLLMDQLDLIQLQVEVRLQSLRNICLTHPREALAWLSIPGIGLVNAATLVAYVGDGSRFSNPHQLLNYAGLVPKQDQSGTVDKKLGIHKQGNRAIRRNIVQGAWRVTTMQPTCPITKYAWHKKAEGKVKQKIAIAVANKMLRTGLALLHHDQLYSPMIAQGFEKLESKLRSYKMKALIGSIHHD
jgi:transposase